MKTHNLFCFILLITAFCLARTLNINVNQPYSCGTLTLYYNSVPGSFYYDTIKCSNGVTLKWYRQTTDIPEFVPLRAGFRFDTSENNFIKVGFKYLQSATWKTTTLGDPGYSISYPYYESSDTIWSSSLRIPDSIANPDSIWNSGIYSLIDTLSGIGKWLFHSSSNGIMGADKPMNNFNNILYVKTKSNNLKLQVMQFFTSSTLHYYPIDSLTLLWAVDSLGNGKFKETTGIAPSKHPSDKPKTPSVFNLKENRNLNFIDNPGNHISLFDIQGRQTHGISHGSTSLPGGVFIYKIDGGNSSILGKVIMR